MKRSHLWKSILSSCLASAGLLPALTGCLPVSKSKLANIFSLDEKLDDKSRRHSASSSEAIWTVKAPGCSALLLDETYVLLAAHCAPKPGDELTSGPALKKGILSDLRIKKVIESDEDLDYAIVEVEWVKTMQKEQKFPPFIARSSSELLIDAAPNQGDTVFSVGFPSDMKEIWPITYAEGQAKHYFQGTLLVNISVINGNSGGAVIKKENSLLVGIVVMGPQDINEKGWNHNDLDNPEQWNIVRPAWDIYRVSNILNKIFPDGKNHKYNDIFVPRTRLYLAVEENEGTIWVAANNEAETVLLCPGAVKDCSRDVASSLKLPFEKMKNDRNLFRLAKPLPQLDNKTYTFAAFNKDNELIGTRRVKFKQKD